MKESKSVKSSSDSRGGKAAAKPHAKRQTAKKPAPRWKVVGDKVVFKPGRYTLADMKAAQRALGGSK